MRKEQRVIAATDGIGTMLSNLETSDELLILMLLAMVASAVAVLWKRYTTRPPRLAKGMEGIPANAVPYKRVPAEESHFFTPNSLPKLLKNRHNTKAGVWGKIVVVSGSLRYRSLESDGKEFLLTSRRYGVASPQRYHQVQPESDDMCCYVLFHHIPDGPDAKKEQ